MSKLFWCDYFISCWNYEKRLIIDTDTETSINQEKDDGFWFVWGVFNSYAWLHLAKSYSGSVKKSKFPLSWHLKIDKKSILEKKIKQKNWFNFKLPVSF